MGPEMLPASHRRIRSLAVEQGLTISAPGPCFTMMSGSLQSTSAVDLSVLQRLQACLFGCLNVHLHPSFCYTHHFELATPLGQSLLQATATGFCILARLPGAGQLIMLLEVAIIECSMPRLDPDRSTMLYCNLCSPCFWQASEPKALIAGHRWSSTVNPWLPSDQAGRVHPAV